MANPHRKARDLSAHDTGSDDSQSSLLENLAQLDTTQGGAVEETRTRLQAVPDLKEELETIEEIKGPEIAEKIEKPEVDGNKIEKKQEVKKSPADLLAQLIKIVGEIDNMDTLEEFAKDCKQKGLLMGGKSEKGWWVKSLKDSDNSKTLVDSISKRKGELIDKTRIAGQLRKIESIDDMDGLRKHLQTLKHFQYIKIGVRGEPIADDQVFGSKEIVEALNRQKEKIVKTLSRQKEGASMEDLLNKFGKR